MSKIHKTTKAEFSRFKKAFLYWQRRLNRRHYRVCFQHAPLKNAYADLHVSHDTMVATVRYATEVESFDYSSDEPEMSAKHEAIHLLISRLKSLGETRFLNRQDMEEEDEWITNVLEQELK